MTDKIDVFEILKQIDKRDVTYFKSLTDDQKKQVVPLLLMRWISSGTPMQTQLVNAIINPLIFKLYKHPELLYKLLVTCSDGKSRRYNWVKKKSKDKSSPVTIEVISEYYRCSKSDAMRFKKNLEMGDVIDMADSLGYDKDKIAKIKVEYK